MNEDDEYKSDESDECREEVCKFQLAAHHPDQNFRLELLLFVEKRYFYSDYVSKK